LSRVNGKHLTATEKAEVFRLIKAGAVRTAKELSERASIGRSTAEKYMRSVDREKAAKVVSAALTEQFTPAEIQDAAFWRRKAAAESRRADQSEKALRELAGMAARPVSPPAWMLPQPGSKGRAAALVHLSDLHVGEVVRPEEIGGINAYDPEIFRRRFRRMIAAACEILPRWSADCDLQGAIVALNGDLISGRIHDELAETNALTSHEQVALATDELAAGIEVIADKLGHVLVTVTPGNHGRTTDRTHAKRIAALSYDTMIGNMLARHFDKDVRVTVQVASGSDLVFPLFGWTILQTHGDGMGTGGGMGFAGPNLPIVRGGKKVALTGFAVGEHYDVILSGHYHTSSNPGRILANGSMVGFSEYGLRLRAEPEPPQQWLGLIHEKWGLRERMPVALEDPARPVRPRVRVPASMQ
jgi:DNA-binding CsgD family transcriptional regulator